MVTFLIITGEIKNVLQPNPACAYAKFVRLAIADKALSSDSVYPILVVDTTLPHSSITACFVTAVPTRLQYPQGGTSSTEPWGLARLARFWGIEEDNI